MATSTSHHIRTRMAWVLTAIYCASLYCGTTAEDTRRKEFVVKDAAAEMGDTLASPNRGVAAWFLLADRAVG